MLTIPRKDTYHEANAIFRWLRECDIHKWVLGAETGQMGYDHWQFRVRCNYNFEQMKALFPTAHIENAGNKWTYEAKGGVYWKADDRKENRQQRFGKLRYCQKRIIETLDDTNDREVVVWYDEEGNAGKSWLTRALWERGQAYYVVPDGNASKIVMDVASEFLNGGWRPYVIIDVPRSGKLTPPIYEAIERIKDGLVKDPRYSSETINISGVKVLVNTNSMPKLDKLSRDRWRIVIQSDLMFEENLIAGPLP